ncbi:MAG TPA: hypothetical protein VIL86_06090, partial [Tepidisphaeraceae bacterium]
FGMALEPIQTRLSPLLSRLPNRVFGSAKAGLKDVWKSEAYSQTCVLPRRYAAQVSEYRDLWHPEIST